MYSIPRILHKTKTVFRTDGIHESTDAFIRIIPYVQL